MKVLEVKYKMKVLEVYIIFASKTRVPVELSAATSHSSISSHPSPTENALSKSVRNVPPTSLYPVIQ